MGLRQRRQERKAAQQRAAATAATGEAAGQLSDAIGRFTSSASRYLSLTTSRALDDLGTSEPVRKAREGVDQATARAGSAAKTARRKTSRWLTLLSLLGFAVVAKKVREQPVPPDVTDPGPDPADVEGRA